MSVTPRLLRSSRTSQKFLFRSILFGDRDVCLQCRLLATHSYSQPPSQRPHRIYGRRPNALPLRSPTAPHLRSMQKRTFMDLVREELINDKELVIDNHKQNRGIPVLATLTRFVDDNIGFEPTTPELLKAFNLIAHDNSPVSIFKDQGTSYGVIRLLEVLSNRDELSLVPDEDLEAALGKLQAVYHDYAVTLAGILLDYVRRTRDHNASLLKTAFEAVAATLANKGEYSKARGILKDGAEIYGKEIITPEAWQYLLQKIIDLDNEDAFLELAESPIARDPDTLGELGVLDGALRFYLDRNDTANAKKWWDELKEAADVKIYKTIFDYALRDLDDTVAKSWVEEMFQHIESRQTSPLDGASEEEIDPTQLSPREILETLKLKWRIIHGESIDKLNNLIPQISPNPNIEIMNELLEFAIWKEDAAMAQFLSLLVDRWRLQQNRRSQILQIRLRMLCNDPAGAVSAWDNLRYFEDSTDSGEETMELLALMASNTQTDPEVIKHFYSDVIARNLPIDADTLCILTDYHLRRSPLDVTMKAITREVHTYTSSDRRKVLKTIGEYMGLPETSAPDAWLIYDVIKQIFLEMDVSVRKDLMQLFFHKGRPDMGVVCFMDFRHSNTKPDTETYTIAYKYLAKHQDGSGVVTVHAMMKLDPEVKPDTELYNSLMWAYNSANLPAKALDVFRTITTTNEGPDGDTLSLVMITIGLMPGEVRRRDGVIWGNFRKLGIVPTIHNHAMRIAAWCMNGAYDEGFQMARELEEKEGIRPDRNVIMALYAEYQPSRRGEIIQWAEEKYPDVWAEIANDPSEPLKQYEGELDRWWKGSGPVLV
ncbi:hypothetical protein ABW19_dt0205405 [Dactylella cylindrospora]|nr:hypothetical protein ABW19_dt0205405 [Dactylella cylindrospora]